MKFAQNIIFPLFSLLLAFTACEKSATAIPVDPEPIINPDRINFQAPEVGQFNAFEAISYECGTAISDENRWELKLTITGVSPETIEFTESYENSANTEVITALRQEGVIAISAEDRQRSRLFFFYGSDSLRLEAPTVADLTYNDCVFFDNGEKFTGDYVAGIPSFELDGKTFKDQKVVSCVPVILDLDGYLFYDQHGLTASITTEVGGFGEIRTTTNVFLLKE
jgi:hypothetical protein